MRFFILLVLLLGTGILRAQHCPLDGSSLVAIRLVDARGQLLNPGRDTIYLQEVDNANPARCSFAGELLKLPLLDSSALFAHYKEMYGPVYDSYLHRQFQKYGVGEKANFMVILNQAQESCMVDKGNEYDYHKRKFIISLYHDQKMITVPVQEADVRSLCTGSKELENFRPVLVRVF